MKKLRNLIYGLLFGLVSVGALAAPTVENNIPSVATGGINPRTLAQRAADQLNIKDYGAVGNTLSFSDGIITTGTNSFCSNSATFNSADVGKFIQIDGASGTAVAPLVTTIASFVSTHCITTTANATATTPQSFLLVRGYGGSLTSITSGTAGSYVPGETVTVTGGTKSTSAVLTVSSTLVRAASVNAGGTGGNNGSCTVTGTTGTNGTAVSYFTAIVTISGNAITAVGSIAGGHYTTNPTSLTAEPVTGCNLTGATLTLSMGVDQAIYSTQGSYTATPSNPVATGAGSSSGATGATFNVGWTTTGTYFYGNDDTTGFNLAIAQSNLLYNAGQQRSCIYVPTGVYWVGSSALTQFVIHNPGCVRGDGMNQSWFVLSPQVSGTLFSWEQAWIPNGILSDGPSINNLAILADQTTTNTQHGAMFLDNNDLALFQNIYMQGLNGSGINIGNLGIAGSGYVRESKFFNIRITESGNSTYPVVNIGSACLSPPCTGSDATNEIAFYGLDIYGSNGRSLAINNGEQQGATRLIRIFGLRLESALPGYDLLDIGDGTIQGQVAAVQIQGLEENSVPVGAMGVRTNGQSTSYSPYSVSVQGVIQTGLGGGVEIDASGGSQEYRFLGIGVSGSNIGVSSSSKVYGAVMFDGLGSEMYWTTNISSTNAKYVLSPTYKYGPNITSANTAAPVGGIVANLHDGTYYGGNPIGAYATDLQSARYLNTQVASGTDATIGGGNANTASGADSTACGGSTNTASGYRATACGGFGNNIQGQYSGSVGGVSNQIGTAGNYARIGGANGFHNRYNADCWADIEILAAGDIQTCLQLLQGVTSSASAVRLTADGGAANGPNCLAISNSENATYALSIDITAVDHTNPSNFETWNTWTGLLSNGTGTTTIQMNSTPTPLTHGTVSGSAIAATADTSLKCLNLAFTPPTSNTDTWHIIAKITSIETY